MNLFRRWMGAGLITVVGLASNSGRAQIWVQQILQQQVTPELVSIDQLPRYGTFWSLQRTNSPPLPFYAPFLRELNAPVYVLDARQGVFLVDDSAVDYVALYRQREAERVLHQVEWENGLLTDMQYQALEGSSPPAMALSSLASTYAYGNAVYLVDMAATNMGASVTSSFSIAGGTNNVPYDILTSTNAALPVTDWSWLGIGYTSNRYTFSGQPLNQAFYVLAKPQKTMVVGWGTNDYQQSGLLLPLTNALMMAGGRAHSLALLGGGTVVGWGNNSYGQISVPTNAAGTVMVAAGWYHSVALRSNGTVLAWGLNLPSVGYTMTNVPADLTNATVISAQALHTLALRSNGTVVAWGYNHSGQTNVPANLSNVVAIAAGLRHSLAAKADGTVVGWGDNTYGERDVPSGLSNVVDVAAGNDHSVALQRDGTVIAWGSNLYGQTNMPSGLSNVVAIAAGSFDSPPNAYTLALKRDNTVVAWGSGSVVLPLGGCSNVIAIAGGAFHALAVRSGPRTPVLTLLPTNQFQIAGGDVTFHSRGAGLYGVGYQWKSNGVNLAGATNPTLTLTNVQAAQAVDYTVTVSNEVGTITSPPAHLYLVTPPVVVSQSPMPTNQVAYWQGSLTLTVNAQAVGETNGFPLGYQWRFNGTNSIGGNSNRYTLFGATNTLGTCSVTVTNGAGGAGVAWQVTNINYGTLAYHLATNAVAHTNGYAPGTNMVELFGWTAVTNTPANLGFITNSTWSTNFWLKGVRGLSASSIGVLNRAGGQGMVTMVSPRHCLFAAHAHSEEERFVAAFLDTNNIVYWRTNLETVHMPESVTYGITNDMAVGILNEELPPSVGYLRVLSGTFANYLPTNNASIIQGIGMNSALRLFSQPMTLVEQNVFVAWNSRATIPFGIATNWSLPTGGGDSSAPERLLIGEQLVLISHNYFGGVDGKGPLYALQLNTLNQYMHYLSTNNYSGTNDYQLTIYSLTNWPIINQ